MGTKTFNNYEDLITFTRASGGHALRPVSYGAELSPNATFTGNIDGWRALNANATATAENNELKIVTTDISGAILDSAMTLEVGKIYLFTATSTSANVSHQIRVGTTSSTAQDVINFPASSSPTTFRHIFVATSTDLWVYLRNTGGAGTVTWDNISVKEVTFDESDGTLTLFEHPDNIPRVEWDADRNRLGLLVEEQRTNLVANSEAVILSYNPASVTVTPNSVVAPDGTTSADLLTSPTQSNAVFNFSSSSFNWNNTNGATFTASIFVKFIDSSEDSFLVYFGGGNSQEGVLITFQRNTTTGEISTIASGASVEKYPNGWYRLAATYTSTGSATTHTFVFNVDKTTTFSLWGAMSEQGASFPTSYIKTTGATATRSADVASIPTADFGFNASEGSVVCEVQHFTTENSSAHAAFAFDDGTSSNRMWYYQNKGQWIGSVSGTTTFSLGVIYPDENALTKVGVTYKKDDYVIYINGDNEGSDTSSNVPVVDTFYIGNTFDSTTRLNGHIKSIKYYPRRLTDAQLQDLTS